MMPERVAVIGNRSELKRRIIGKIPNTSSRIYCCVAGWKAKFLTASPKAGGLPIDSGNLHVAADEDGARGIRGDVAKLVGIPASTEE